MLVAKPSKLKATKQPVSPKAGVSIYWRVSATPFQIDGNFGGAAAVAEMLVQSTDKQINLLPALPDSWSEGSVSGICARGGFVVSIDWAKKTPKTVSISSKIGGKTTLVCGNKQKTITLPKGRKVTVKW